MICFDTMVLIWGVQGHATPGQEEMVERTTRFIESLREANEQVMIPTPALAEYLEGFEGDDRLTQLKILERGFRTPAFDLPAAYLAAGLARKAAGVPRGENTRHAVKADVQIIATAIHHGASVIVTNERVRFEGIADGRIRVIDVPSVHQQTKLDLGGYDA